MFAQILGLDGLSALARMIDGRNDMAADDANAAEGARKATPIVNGNEETPPR